MEKNYNTCPFCSNTGWIFTQEPYSSKDASLTNYAAPCPHCSGVKKILVETECLQHKKPMG